MGKHYSSKKTEPIKRVLVSIIYHNQEIDLENLLKKIKIKKQDSFLIIFDNIKNISLNKKLKKKYKNIDFIFGNRKTKKVPYYRNQAVMFGMRKYEEGTLILIPGWVPYRISKNDSQQDHILITGILGQ